MTVEETCVACNDTGYIILYGICPLCDGHGLKGLIKSCKQWRRREVKKAKKKNKQSSESP